MTPPPHQSANMIAKKSSSGASSPPPTRSRRGRPPPFSSSSSTYFSSRSSVVRFQSPEEVEEERSHRNKAASSSKNSSSSSSKSSREKDLEDTAAAVERLVLQQQQAKGGSGGSTVGKEHAAFFRTSSAAGLILSEGGRSKATAIDSSNSHNNSSSNSSHSSSGGIDAAAAATGGGRSRSSGEKGLFFAGEDAFSGSGGEVSAAAAAQVEEAANELQIPLQRLSWWASLLPQPRAELLTELGGSCLFLLHGESLLLHLMRKVYVNFDVRKGLQPLVYVHLVERQLRALQEAGAVFYLVFFEIFRFAKTSGTAAAAAAAGPALSGCCSDDDSVVEDCCCSCSSPKPAEQHMLELCDQSKSQQSEAVGAENEEEEEEEDEEEEMLSSVGLLPHAFALAREQLLLHLLTTAAAVVDTEKSASVVCATAFERESVETRTAENKGTLSHARRGGGGAGATADVVAAGSSSVVEASSFPAAPRVCVLKDWFGDAWQSLLLRLHPSLLLLQDIDFPTQKTSSTITTAGGAKKRTLKSTSQEEQLQTVVEAEAKRRGRIWVAWLLQSLALSSCSHGVNVGLMQHIVYKPTKIFTRAVTSEAAAQRWSYLEKKLLRRGGGSLLKRLASSSGSPVVGDGSAAMRMTTEQQVVGLGDKREASATEIASSTKMGDRPVLTAPAADAAALVEEKVGEAPVAAAAAPPAVEVDKKEAQVVEEEELSGRQQMARALKELEFLLSPDSLRSDSGRVGDGGDGGDGDGGGGGEVAVETQEEEAQSLQQQQLRLTETLRRLEVLADVHPQSLQSPCMQSRGGGEGEEGGGKKAATVSVFFLLAFRFCQFLKTVAEEEAQQDPLNAQENDSCDDSSDDEDGGSRSSADGAESASEAGAAGVDSQRQIAQFVAVGKLLLMAAAVMQQLSLLQRNHQSVESPEKQPFISEFLYAPLNLFVLEACKTLRLLRGLFFPNSLIVSGADIGRCLSASSASAAAMKVDSAENLHALLRRDEVADLFDGRLFFTLVSITCDFARSSGNWQVPASFFGLKPKTATALNEAWKSVVLEPVGISSSSSQTVILSGTGANKFFTNLFPIDLSSLAKLLEDLPLSLPKRLLALSPSSSLSLSSQENATTAANSAADLSTEKDAFLAENLPELLELESGFLRRFSLKREGGALMCVNMTRFEAAPEDVLLSAESNKKELKKKQHGDSQAESARPPRILASDGGNFVTEKKSTTYEKTKQLVQKVVRSEAVKEFNRLVVLAPAEEIRTDFAQLEMSEVDRRSKELGEYSTQKMKQMNGEERRRFFEMALRRREQYLQMELRQKAKSLCPQPLHLPITLKEEHPWAQQHLQGDGDQRQQVGLVSEREKGKEKKKPKPLKKSELIRLGVNSIQEKKVQNLDLERLQGLEKRLEALCVEYSGHTAGGRAGAISSFTRNGVPLSISSEKLSNLIYEVLVGPNTKRLGLLLNFPYVLMLLKTRAAQKSFVMKVLLLFQDVYAGFQIESCTTKTAFLQMQQLLCMLFRVSVETLRLFGGELEGKDIEEIQKSLLSLGFKEAAHKSFESWRIKRLLFLQQQQQQSLSPADPAAAVKTKKDKKTSGKRQGEKVHAKEATIEAATLELHRVTRSIPFDFRIKPDMELRVQLRMMGGDLARTTGSSTKKDSRVLFTPDYWQVQLLDIIDKHESAFVTAPTSSGKTFICFYAMEKVLQYDDVATVVYVSPSKALADQVYAEIYGRFSSKTLSGKERSSNSSSRSSGDSKENSVFVKGEIGVKKLLSAQFLDNRATPSPLAAQVVVTLPSVLEMLLMSGAYQYWVRTLKYVILDEIHCISQDESGGDQWERLIQLLPCPFLAMSATVGNPDSFMNWMARASPDYPITHVDYKERFSDLHLILYHNNELLPLNPVASLHFEKVREEGLSSDFYVPPFEGLGVYDVFSKLLGNSHSLSRDFQPSYFFSGCSAITKRQYRFYWNSLRSALVDLVQSGELTAADFAAAQKALQEELLDAWAADVSYFHNLHRYMAAALPRRFASSSQQTGRTGEELQPFVGHAQDKSSLQKMNYLEAVLARREFTKAYLDPDKLIGLCRQLDSAQMLPCLIFNFYRNEIRQMGVRMAKRLKDLQLQKYYGTEEAAYRTRLLNKKRLEQYQAAIAQRAMQAKMRGMSWKQREAQGLGKDDVTEEIEEELPPPPIDIAEEIDEDFSFASLRAMGTNFDDVRGAIERVKRKSSSTTDQALIEGLERGIGVYDSGLSRVYREAVDILFRIGFLRVCICSNALALGMNLPCKTSVFAGDAFVLTPTLFKQSAGRAGRRGYDAKGHVVLWEIPFSKINRLCEARLPVFGGDFPVTPMMTLRTLRFYGQMEGSGDSEEERVVQGLQRLFLQPLFSVSPSNTNPKATQLENLRFYVRYHFRFLCDLLTRLGVLHNGRQGTGGGCRPSIWGYVVELLYESGTPSFLFHYFIFSGILEKHLQQQATDEEKALFLLRVLSLCVGAEAVHSGDLLRHRLHLACVMRKALQEQQQQQQQGVKKRIGGVGATLPPPHFKPLMPLLPDEFEAAIDAYNQLACDASIRCVRSACAVIDSCQQGFQPIDFQLPFTKLCFPCVQSSENKSMHASQSGGNVSFQNSSKNASSHKSSSRISSSDKSNSMHNSSHNSSSVSGWEGETGRQEMEEHAADAAVATSRAAISAAERSSDDVCEILSLFHRLQQRNVTRSPFAAITGQLDNDFSSLIELQDSVRVLLPFYPETMSAAVEAKRVQLHYWDGKQAASIKMRSQNNYLVDLFFSRSFAHVTQESQVSASRIWFLVGDVLRSLSCLKRATKLRADPNWAAGANSDIGQATVLLHAEIEKIFKKESA